MFGEGSNNLETGNISLHCYEGTMIQITDKTQCCGCNACGDACAHKAITFRTDFEGFWYPEINKEFCTQCGLCEKICPILHPANKIVRYDEPRVFAAYTKDEAIRIDSTSGGIHSMLAQAMYNKNAFVGGAIYNDDHTVSQIIDDNPARLPEIRSSKYLQSDASGVYKEIRQKLRDGREVFFCGCPCQIQALYSFLGNKEYDNLTTCDFICRGVNSPKVFLKYMEMLERQYGALATNIKFKNKKWGWHNFSMRVNFANGKEYCKDRYHDLFFIGYLAAGNFTRPSCYDCQFKGFPQKADITLADFWGIEDIDQTMDQDLGTSLVMINSEKGLSLFESIKDCIVWKEFTIAEARKCNPAMDSSLHVTYGNREDFFNDLEKYPFDVVAKKHFPQPYKRPSFAIRILKRIYHTYQKLLGTASIIGYSPLSWLTFIWINLINKHVKREANCFILNHTHSLFQFEKGAKITLNATFTTGKKQVRASKQETRILLEQDSQLIVKGAFSCFAGSFIRLTPNSKLILHGGFINENVQITVGDTIEIGEGFTCGRDVVIRSYDGHTIKRKDYKISEPIKIGKHVWIGQGATILKGVSIGDGAIIASGAIVVKDVPANSIVAGIPAKVVSENVQWE